MASRHADWLRQADADLGFARHARDGHAHDWACFATHQAAEKAFRAVLMSRGDRCLGPHGDCAARCRHRGRRRRGGLGGLREDARQALHSGALPQWPRCGSTGGLLYQEGLRRCHRLRRTTHRLRSSSSRTTQRPLNKRFAVGRQGSQRRGPRCGASSGSARAVKRDSVSGQRCRRMPDARALRQAVPGTRRRLPARWGFQWGWTCFPYTLEELERLRRDHPSWHRALTAGVGPAVGLKPL